MEDNKQCYYLIARNRQTEKKALLIRSEGLIIPETKDHVYLKNAKIIAGYLDASLYYDKDGNMSMSGLFIRYMIPYIEIFMSQKPGEVFDSDESAILYYELQE